MKKKPAGRMNDYVKLKGSEKSAPDAVKLDTLNANDSMEVTIRVRRKKSLDQALNTGERITREEYEKEFGTSSADIEKVEEFALENNLSVVESSSARRSVIVRGKVKDFENAFKIHLSNYRQSDGTVFRGRSGHLQIPRKYEDIIEGVFGCDDRIHARPMFHRIIHDGFISPRLNSFQGYGANEVADAYGFPKNETGKGQCIGIIELGGGYRLADLKAYFKELGIKAPHVKSVSVDGTFNNPSTADSDDGEVVLDVEVAGVVAPEATIVVYFAPNTDSGFLDAITRAIHDARNQPSVISISWGSAEKNWTLQSLHSYNEAFKAAAVLGVTICVAAGDHGATDGIHDGKVHADFPASSPYVLGCGGTRLEIKQKKVLSEIVWHEDQVWLTGGGVSEFFDLPDYQKNSHVPLSLDKKFKGRGVPDVAGNASGDTGYKVLVDGEWGVTGGTSAVAPLMAGLIALINEKKKAPVGFINPKLYDKPGNFCRDISHGNNINGTNNKGFKASAGWDACTGWGVMNKI